MKVRGMVVDDMDVGARLEWMTWMSRGMWCGYDGCQGIVVDKINVN